MIGSLMYLTASRPDIFSTCLCARYQDNPKESRLVAIKRIFRCNLDRKSTLVGYQILGGKLVCWSAKKQSSVAMSSAKAEYVVVAGCCAQVSRLKVSWLTMMFSMTRYHFIRDHILKGDIELHFVPIDMQQADIFPKPLVKPNFTRLVAELGMLNIKKGIPDKKML
ncbi:hypothetical protein Tco_0828377 [Tanacetum coccineum]